MKLAMILLARLVLAAVLAVPPAFAASAAATVETGQTRVSLITEHASAAPGETLWAALKIEMQPGWHTFWRNPGDAGLPTEIHWTLPPGVTAGPIQWPVPERIPYISLMNFGYHDTAMLLVELAVAPDAPLGEAILEAQALWQVCEEICIPEEGAFSVPLRIDPSPLRQNTIDGAAIDGARAALPPPAPWPVRIARSGADIIVTAETGAGAATDAFWFPNDRGIIVSAAPQAFAAVPGGIRLTAAADTFPVITPRPAESAGLLVIEDSRGAQSAYAFSAPLPPLSPQGASAVVDPVAALGLAAAVLFALAGGVILNLMPCVLPVLAMKAVGFMSKADNAGALRRDGLAYTTGVLFTAMLLVSVLLALRAGGEAVGWGFQLQSPAFVTAMAYLIFALGLSLSGVFVLGGGVMGMGQSLAARSGPGGAFFTGALVVVVATPCTAPLMGAAMGYALTQPVPAALAVFLSLAFGLALPYLALSFSPGLARRLPRPGPWMERLKHVLAFPMYGAAAWLVWVVAQQLGRAGLAAVLAGLVLVAFAAWCWGVAAASARAGAWRTAAGIAAVLAAVMLATGAKDTAVAAAAEGAARPWSPARVAELQAEGRPVFVNFTAAWCITCLVNERVALSSPTVAAAMDRNGVTYLKADWTNRNAEIAAALKALGRSGVPLYVLYGRDGTAALLPQVLTPETVVAALDAL